MLRALVEPDLTPVAGGVVTLEGGEAHHVARVRRAGEGDAIELLDGAGLRANGAIVSIGAGRRGTVDIAIERVETKPPATPAVHIFGASPKGDRLGQMIESLSEVGAATWWPVISQRSVVEPRDAKIDKLRRVARESIKQCGRAWVMEIGDSLGFEAALERAVACDVTVLAEPGGASMATAIDHNTTSIAILIGPEGGWSPEEASAAKAAGVRSVSIGPNVMRIGTAAVVAAGLAMQRGAGPA